MDAGGQPGSVVMAVLRGTHAPASPCLGRLGITACSVSRSVKGVCTIIRASPLLRVTSSKILHE